MNKRRLKDLAGLLLYVFLVLAILFLVNNYVFEQFRVSGSSMEETLLDNDVVMLGKINATLGMIGRGDIIVFKYLYGTDEWYIKRVIGLPGETVRITDGSIYINGEELEEQYSDTPIRNPGLAAREMKLSDDEYFVLGDNREKSVDSRFADVGLIKKKNIRGVVLFRMFPLDRFGAV